MITQDRLDQARIDKTIAMDRADKEIARLEQEIKDEEVTYSIGDRFKAYGTRKFILTDTNDSRSIQMVGLGTGIAFSNASLVINPKRIALVEMKQAVEMFSDFTRYWDNRKQVQV